MRRYQPTGGDYSGSLGDHALGIAVMTHPANLQTLFRVRAYGSFGRSPFFAADHRLPAGERLLFRYRVVVGDASAVGLPRLFDELRNGERLYRFPTDATAPSS